MPKYKAEKTHCAECRGRAHLITNGDGRLATDCKKCGVLVLPSPQYDGPGARRKKAQPVPGNLGTVAGHKRKAYRRRSGEEEEEEDDGGA